QRVRQRGVACAIEVAFLQQRALGVGNLLVRETVLRRASKLLVEPGAQPCRHLRCEGRRYIEARVGLEAADPEAARETRGQSLFLSDARPQAGIGRAADDVVREQERGIVGVAVTQRKRGLAADVGIGLVRCLERHLRGNLRYERIGYAREVLARLPVAEQLLQ